MWRGIVRRLIVLVVLITVVSAGFVPMLASAQISTDYPLKTGPFVDKIIYNVITHEDQAVLALLNNEIDLIGDLVDFRFSDTLLEDTNIGVATTLRNGYGYLSINTEKYPLNITAFRRAFAFALDKERISDEVWDGLSVPQDSRVPQINPFSIEGQLSYDYYASNVTLGNQLLDAAGFLDVDDDGYRDAPNGLAFDIEVFSAVSTNIALEVGAIAVEALVALGINAYHNRNDWYPYPLENFWLNDHDIVFLGNGFTNFDVDWLAYEYWSENANVTYLNLPHWRNSTYDSWRNQLLNASTYEEAYEAAIEMQRIFVYECPIVVTYENMLVSAYRTDRFNGFVNSVQRGIPCWWTNYKVNLKSNENGPFGGTLRWSNPLDIDTFNFMVTSSSYTNNVLQMTHDSLIKQDPNGLDIPWLAESYTIETHDDNPSIVEGNTRLTFQIIDNATWSDGMPLTSEDVAFTLNYYQDAPGNPYGEDLDYMIAAYAPTAYTVVVVFETESFWHLHKVGYKPILPKHVFQTIGLEGWNLYNPDPPTVPMVTSGPLNVSHYVAGEYVELTRNPSYFYHPDIPPTNTTVTSEEPDPWNLLSSTPIILTGAALCVIVVVFVKWHLDTRG